MDKPVYKVFTVSHKSGKEKSEQEILERKLNEYYEEGYRVDMMNTTNYISDIDNTHTNLSVYHVIMKLADSD